MYMYSYKNKQAMRDAPSVDSTVPSQPAEAMFHNRHIGKTPMLHREFVCGRRANVLLSLSFRCFCYIHDAYIPCKSLLLSAHIVAMSQPNGYDEFDEEEQIDLQAELEEGFAEIEQK